MKSSRECEDRCGGVEIDRRRKFLLAKMSESANILTNSEGTLDSLLLITPLLKFKIDYEDFLRYLN